MNKNLLHQVTINGRSSVMNCEISHSQWLLQYPHSIYTVARTVKQFRVFQLNKHLKRLQDNIELMNMKNINVQSIIVPYITESLSIYAPKCEASDEFRICILLKLTMNGSFDTLIHLSRLVAPASKVFVRIEPIIRSMGQSKNTDWVLEHQKLKEMMKRQNIEEVIMLNTENYDLSEGLSSNFFVVYENQVYTADPMQHGVLAGTVRDVILQECTKMNIKVNFICPKINNGIETIRQWDGCFISSTSRLLLPIDELQLNDNTSHKFVYDSQSLISKLQQAVLSSIEANSESILSINNES